MALSDHQRQEIIPVCAAVIIRDGRVLVGRRDPRVPDPGRWELPGGKLLPGEDPRACLVRELHEELGVSSRVGDLYDVVNHHYERFSVLLIVYRTSISSGELSSHDHDLLLWAGPDELGRLDFLEADRPVVKRLIEEIARGGP